MLAGYDIGSRIAQAIAARHARAGARAGRLAAAARASGERVLGPDAHARVLVPGLPPARRWPSGSSTATRPRCAPTCAHFWTHWSGPGFVPDRRAPGPPRRRLRASRARSPRRSAGTAPARGPSPARWRRRAARASGSPRRRRCCGRSTTRCSRGPGRTGSTSSSPTRAALARRRRPLHTAGGARGVRRGDPRAALAREVGRRGARAVRAALRLLPVLLAPERGEVEEVVRAAGRLRAARVGRVGVEDAVVVAQEEAVPGISTGCVELRARRLGSAGAVVVRRAASTDVVDGDAEVVVEVAAVRRVPGERPALASPSSARASPAARARRRRAWCRARAGARSRPADISSAPAEQLGQPSSHSGSNMKWPTISCARPSNRSSRPTSPSGR